MWGWTTKTHSVKGRTIAAVVAGSFTAAFFTAKAINLNVDDSLHPSELVGWWEGDHNIAGTGIGYRLVSQDTSREMIYLLKNGIAMVGTVAYHNDGGYRPGAYQLIWATHGNRLFFFRPDAPLGRGNALMAGEYKITNNTDSEKILTINCLNGKATYTKFDK